MNITLTKKLRVCALVLFIFSIIFMFIGFYKVLVYENPDSEYSGRNREYKNAYVEMDDTNYITNGIYFIGYCILSGTFFISATLLLLFSFECMDKVSSDDDISEIDIPEL